MVQIDPELMALINQGDNETEVRNYDDSIGVDDETDPLIGDTTVELPGGILTEQGVVRVVTVRELNGYDEEALARSDVKRPIDYLNRLLKVGWLDVGGKKPTSTMLDQLLIGDRDAIIIGVRRATFGNDIEMRELVCPSCDKPFDVVVGLDEFESTSLEDPLADRVFSLKLSKSIAKVRLATHGDIVSMVDASSKAVEQNNVMLSRCIIDIDGVPLALNPEVTPEEAVRRLNMRDRAVVLEEMSKRQPGPDLTGVKISCPSCDFEDRIGLDLISLFRI